MNSLTVPPTLSNYSLTKTVTSGQTFRWCPAPQSQIETPFSKIETDVYYLPTSINETPIVYKLKQNKPHKIKWTTITNQTEIPQSTVKQYLKKRLGFTYDYSDAFNKLKKTDSWLYKATQKHLSLIQDPPFPTVISFICSPQATIDRIYTMQKQLEMQYGTPVKTENGKFYLFPTPSQLIQATTEDLQDLKLGYRAKYVAQTTQQIIQNNPLPKQSTSLTTRDLRSHLKEYMGVGQKVADCVLLYAYARTEVVPIDTRIKQMGKEYYLSDKNISVPAILEQKWPSKHRGFFQLLLYDAASSK